MKELIWVEPNSERWLSLEDLPNEEWRDIKDFEGLYQVSNYGRVKSLDRFIDKKHHYLEKIIKLRNGKNGYLTFTLCKNGMKKQQGVHRIVAYAFPEICGEWFAKCEVDHLDTVTYNNQAINLKVCTHVENANNPITLSRNSNKLRMKPIVQLSLNNEFIREFSCVGEIIKNNNKYSQGNIRSCCKGRYKTAYGYIWKYKEDTNGMEI